MRIEENRTGLRGLGTLTILHEPVHYGNYLVNYEGKITGFDTHSTDFRESNNAFI
jgi:hypothetical protein